MTERFREQIEFIAEYGVSFLTEELERAQEED